MLITFYEVNMKTPSKNNPRCSFCNSKNTISKGPRKNKYQLIPRFKCKSCNRYFTNQKTKHITYPIRIIFDSISAYNLGCTLKDTTRYIKKKYNLTITPQTILFWLKKFKKQLPYHRIRKRIKKLYTPEDIIKRRIMKHHDQPFNFQYHKAKLELFCNRFPQLKRYIPYIEKNCPNSLFKNSNRISQYKQDLKDLNIKLLKKRTMQIH